MIRLCLDVEVPLATAKSRLHLPTAHRTFVHLRRHLRLIDRSGVVPVIHEALIGWHDLCMARLGAPVPQHDFTMTMTRERFHERVQPLADMTMYWTWNAPATAVTETWLLGLYDAIVTTPVRRAANRMCRDVAILRKILKEGSVKQRDHSWKNIPSCGFPVDFMEEVLMRT